MAQVKARVLTILIIGLFFAGCASSTVHRDESGSVWKITTWGSIHTTYEHEGEKIEADSKYEFFKGIFNLNKVSAA